MIVSSIKGGFNPPGLYHKKRTGYIKIIMLHKDMAGIALPQEEADHARD